MENGRLFNQKQKIYLDTLLQHIGDIAKAVNDARQDLPKSDFSLAGTNLISRPTESQALKNIKPLKCVYVPGYGFVNSPEQWLKIYRRVCVLYQNSKILEIAYLRYINHELKKPAITERQSLNKFLSDCFILAVANKLIKI